MIIFINFNIGMEEGKKKRKGNGNGIGSSAGLLSLFIIIFILSVEVVQCKLEIKTLTEETLKEEVAFSNWLVLLYSSLL